MFADVPPVLARRIYLVAMRRLFGKGPLDADSTKRFRIALGFDDGTTPDTLRLPDIVDVGELIARSEV